MLHNTDNVVIEITQREELRQQLLRFIVAKEARREAARHALLWQLGLNKLVPNSAPGPLPP